MLVHRCVSSHYAPRAVSRNARKQSLAVTTPTRVPWSTTGRQPMPHLLWLASAMPSCGEREALVYQAFRYFSPLPGGAPQDRVSMMRTLCHLGGCRWTATRVG